MTDRRRAVTVVVALVAGGCARLPSARLPWAWRDGTIGSASADVAWGDDLAAHKEPVAARDVYQRVLREHGKDPVGGDALWGLALLLVDAESPLCDYHAGLVAFDRFLADYPASRHAGEARAWRAVLRQTQRLEAEAGRLRADLDRLKQLDMEMERR